MRLSEFETLLEFWIILKTKTSPDFEKWFNLVKQYICQRLFLCLKCDVVKNFFSSKFIEFSYSCLRGSKVVFAKILSSSKKYVTISEISFFLKLIFLKFLENSYSFFIIYFMVNSDVFLGFINHFQWNIRTKFSISKWFRISKFWYVI